MRRFPNAPGRHRARAVAGGARAAAGAVGDWPLLLSRRPDAEAIRRPREHLLRCDGNAPLAEAADWSEEDCAFLDAVEEWDNPFPMLNYRVFAD
ncbi:hypothetical protein [Kouleothrix sp.]|uniref:hypothetical protein n=1 Tax=Kouleothrix sp. TaxID=2779161 RepID=UPI00391D2C95